MKSWLAVVLLLCFAGLALFARSVLRERVTIWLVRRSGTTRGGGRGQAVMLFGGMSGLAVATLAAGYGCRATGGAVGAGRYVAAAVVIAACVPVMSLGAPRTTRWQKTFEHRLVLAGGAPEAAAGAASVARPVSALAVLAAVAAIPLFF